MMNRFETYFDVFYAYFTTKTGQFKTLGQFENLGFVIMSTRENISLIARAPSDVTRNYYAFNTHLDSLAQQEIFAPFRHS